MSRVISIRDLQDMVRDGQDVKNLPADAIITPSARDFLHDLQTNSAAKNGANNNAVIPNSAGGDKLSPPAKKLNSKSSKSELEAFFNSPYAQNLKEQLCDIGRRLWQREYVDGNGGNIAIRVGEDIAICTPTLVS
jgi:L-fuculose-phosphate aldolase